MLNQNDIRLLERCQAIIRFLATDPTDEQCQTYMVAHDIRMTGARKSERQLLTIHAGLHVNRILDRVRLLAAALDGG